MKYFISDTHFFHYNVIKYENRPFLHIVDRNKILFNNKLIVEYSKFLYLLSSFIHMLGFDHFIRKKIEKEARFLSVKLMNQHMINEWNSVISPEDTVYFNGDFSYGSINMGRRIVNKLNGYKIAIIGNHDKKAKRLLDMGFDEAHHELVIKIGGDDVLLSHYPYVDPVLNELAKKRPNIITMTESDEKDFSDNIDISKKMNYDESKEFLKKWYKYPIKIKNPKGKRVHSYFKRLITRYIGTRPINNGLFLIHGHVHGKWNRVGNMLNVSCEVLNYKPKSEDQVIKDIQEYKDEINGDNISQDNFNDDRWNYYTNKYFYNNEKVKLEFKKIFELRNLYYQLNEYKNKKNDFYKYLRKVPRDYSDKWYNTVKELGMFIPMEKLKDKKFYKGNCRNSRFALWDANKNKFYYLRTKFGSKFIESINPIEKDNGFDLFIPHEEYQPSEEELNYFKKYL